MRSAPSTSTPVERRPVVVTSDEQTLEELLRLCAAADVVPVVAGDVASARRAWASAAVVLVDAVEAGHLAAHSPPRRPDVHLVTRAGGGDGAWRSAVALGAEHVHVLPDDERALVDALAASAEPVADDSAVVAVVAGSGGAGASTIAAALAVTASRRGTSTLLVDADPLGGGIDLVVGAEDSQGLRWPDLAGTEGRLSGESLRDALPRSAGLSVLSWDRGDAPAVSAESMRSVLAAGRRAGSLVVVDVARRLDAAAEEALLVAHLTLLVVSADVRGVAAATRTLASVRDLTGEVGLVVRGPGPSGLDADLVASTLGAPLVARVRDDRRLAAAVDEGLGPVAHRRGTVAAAVAQVLDVLHPPRVVA